MAGPPGCPGGGRTTEGVGGVGRGGVGVDAGFCHITEKEVKSERTNRFKPIYIRNWYVSH